MTKLKTLKGSPPPGRIQEALEGEERYQALLKRIPGGVVVADRDGHMTTVNQRWCDMLGYQEAELLGLSIVAVTHPESLAATLKAVRRLSEGGPEFDIEKRYVRKDGSSFWALSSVSALRGASGEYNGLIAIVLDISDRKQAEVHRELLLDELNHRVKNTLAIVQSFVNQTLRNATSMEEASEGLSSRLIGLAKAHDVLTREQWNGADLRDVVAAAIAAYTEGFQSPRFRIDGPGLRLRPKAVLAMSMALHELATNAVKYGALSVDAGLVEIEWHVSGDRFGLRWRESGGPRVQMPLRRGFGSRLVETGLAQDLGGDVTLDFAPSGVICSIDAPVAEIAATGS
jgi:PAS domain S-box-containing protein